MDRNQAIGLILIFMILVAYFNFFAPEPQAPEKKKTTTEQAAKDTLAAAMPTDSASLAKMGDFANALTGESKQVVLENKDVKIVFDTKGGTFKSVLLKNYTTYSKEPLYLFNANNRFDFELPTTKGNINLNNLYYTTDAASVTTVDNGKKQITFKLALNATSFVEKIYTLDAEGFEVGYFVRVQGLDGEMVGKEATISMAETVVKVEKELEQSRANTTVNYFLKDGTFDYLSERSTDTEQEKIENAAWISFKKKFFVNGFVADKPLMSASIKSEVDIENKNEIKKLYADIKYPVDELKKGADFKFYFGPNKEKYVSKVAEGFQNNLYLGWTIFGSINRWVIYPVFTFLEQYITNYGMLIFLLVFFIKLILSPLTYSSYLSMAKMKVLKPELDEIKARVGDDMQAQQAESMKLYQQVGVNPLSGCIPVLLQMPILLAMFNLFPNLIELRGQSFWWAEDLSTYDSLITLPFTIPFYGDHVSLFTLMMTVSTLVYTWYNSQMTTSMTGPMMYMQYMMPVVFLFVMNTFPAGLSFYYFVSNLFTIGQQMLTKQFVDETKIREQLDKNKTAAPTRKPNRFMQRMEEAMKEAQTQKPKGKK